MAEETVTYTIDVHHEDNGYWAEVQELPGCFASGHTLEELYESLEEAVGLYLSSNVDRVTVRLVPTGQERREFQLSRAS